VAQGDRELPGRILDLSLLGAYVQMEERLGNGVQVVLSFQVPGNLRTLRPQAVVVWVNQTQNHPVHSLPPGCGLRFVSIEPVDLDLIGSAIRDYCSRNPLYRQYL
jgi:hypothetical protein